MRARLLSRRMAAGLLCLSGLWLTAACAAAAESQALAFKVESPDSAPFGAITIFLVVLAGLLLLLLSFLKKKRAGSQPARWLNWLPAQQDNEALQIVASKRVTPKVSVHVVEWEGGKVLFAVSDQQVTRLDEAAAAPHARSTGEGP